MDRSRNFIEVTNKKIAELKKTIALNDRCIVEYAAFCTPEYLAVVSAENEALRAQLAILESEV